MDNEKAYKEKVKVLFLNDSTYTDVNGYFSFFYDFLDNEGKDRILLLKFTEKYFEENYVVTLSTDNIFNGYFISPKVSFELELFSMRESEKALLNNVDVKLNGESVSEVSAGKYTKDNLRLDSYKLSINYPGFETITDSVKLSSIENKFSYEMTNIIDEDMMYVQNNNYFLRYSDGETKQITYSNENISSGVEFYSDKNRFIYLSSLDGNYKINEIDLNNLSHTVIFSTNIAIRNLRISPDEDRIYYVKSAIEYWKGSIFYFDLYSQQEVEVNPGPFFKVLLFNDCNRIAYRDLDSFGSLKIVDNVRKDSSVYFGNPTIYPLCISNNDKYLVISTQHDIHNYDYIYDIVNTLDYSYERYFNIDNGILGIIDNREELYGYEYIENRFASMGVNLFIMDIVTGNKTIVDEIIMGIDFKVLSYSEKSNKYLYSINGDIKVYNATTGISSNIISTDYYEHSARFVSIN